MFPKGGVVIWYFAVLLATSWSHGAGPYAPGCSPAASHVKLSLQFTPSWFTVTSKHCITANFMIVERLGSVCVMIYFLEFDWWAQVAVSTQGVQVALW
jgi:hypothetical protein